MTALFILLTIGVYFCVRYASFKYNHPLINIVALSAGIIIFLLIVGDFSYEQYTPAKNIMTFLLGPAITALALPLYRYREVLRRSIVAIMSSVGVGAFVGMFLAGAIAQWYGLPHEIVMSIVPKGVAIPFAVEIAEMYGGVPALATAFVVATAVLGAFFGFWLLRFIKITNPMAQGLSMGTIAHTMGTATALREGVEEGAMAGLALILAGIFTALFAPVVVWLLGVIN